MQVKITSIRSFKEYVEHVTHRSKAWIFRGQERAEWPLASSLERALEARGIPLEKAPEIERQIIRDFRRRYEGPQFDLIQEDTLYCMAVMQHHGAPTRLLDWTYSPYVAAKFALERGFVDRVPAVWCLRAQWAVEHVEQTDKRFIQRSCDHSRKDSSFVPLFMEQRRACAYPENALNLNERLIVQQGVFVCPGDVGKTMKANFEAMPGWNDQANLFKLTLDLDKNGFDEFSDCLRRMNVSSAALFPGIDGVARSQNEHLFHYDYMADTGAGLSRP